MLGLRSLDRHDEESTRARVRGAIICLRPDSGSPAESTRARVRGAIHVRILRECLAGIHSRPRARCDTPPAAMIPKR